MIELKTISYGCDEADLKGQLATPSINGKRPGVLVMHDARGQGELVRKRAGDLAGLGYVALATDMYGDAIHFDNAMDAGALMLPLEADPEKLRARVLAGFETLKAQPDVDPSRIAAIGFCFGGLCVLELARTGADVKAVVSYHGLLKTKIPAEPGTIKPEVVALCGGKDPYAPLEDRNAFADEMNAAGASWQMTTYSEAYHAFTDPSASTMTNIPGVKYDPLAATLSWDATVSLLKATL